MLVLFTDTDTDITPAIAKQYDYHLISMPYSIDGKTYYPYEDSDTIDFHAFYEQLRSGVLPNTSAISKERYLQYFEPFLANGDDILYVHFSAAMSMTFNAMDEAVKELEEKYPGRKIYSIDTKAISILSLNVAYEVGDMVKAGKTIDEILAWAAEEVDHFAVYFFADDLKFFKHSGRVSGLAATMGTLLGVRPIIYMNQEGKMVSIGKERGRSKAVDRLIQYVLDLGDHVKDHRVLVANSDSPDIAEEICGILKEKFGDDLHVEIINVNPTAGSHCGPNAVGITFHSIHR